MFLTGGDHTLSRESAGWCWHTGRLLILSNSWYFTVKMTTCSAATTTTTTTTTTTKKKRKEKKTWEKEKGQQIRKSTPLIISNVQMHAQDTEQSMYFDLVAIWIELKGYSQLCKYIYIFKYYFSILLWSKFFGNQ